VLSFLVLFNAGKSKDLGHELGDVWGKMWCLLCGSIEFMWHSFGALSVAKT